jgi:hypothetical protein
MHIPMGRHRPERQHNLSRKHLWNIAKLRTGNSSRSVTTRHIRPQNNGCQLSLHVWDWHVFRDSAPCTRSRLFHPVRQPKRHGTLRRWSHARRDQSGKAVRDLQPVGRVALLSLLVSRSRRDRERTADLHARTSTFRTAGAFGKDGTGETGTLVVWSKCDRLTQGEDGTVNDLGTVRQELLQWLSRTYRHFLDGGRKIFLNGDPIQPHDPLYLMTVPRLATDPKAEVLLEDFIEWSVPSDTSWVIGRFWRLLGFCK